MVCKLWLEMQGEKQRCCVLKSSYEGHRCFLWKIFTQKAQIFTEGLFVQFGTNFCFMPSDLYFFQRVMCSVFVYGVVFLWYKKKWRENRFHAYYIFLCNGLLRIFGNANAGSVCKCVWNECLSWETICWSHSEVS